MEDSKIKILLDAFYEGKTTDSDEKELFDYFNNTEVSDDLKEDKYLYLHMYNTTGKSNIDIPSDLESKIETLIDALDRQDKSKIRNKRKQLLIKSISVAASLVILFSVGYLMKQESDSKQQTAGVTPVENYQFSEDEIKALQETERVLLIFSSNFNKSLEPIALMSEKVNKTNNILSSTLKTKKTKKI